MKNTLIILIVFASGIVFGRFYDDPEILSYMTEASSLALYVLMFLVGLSLGSDKSIGQSLKSMGWRALLLPFWIMAGSLLAGALFFLIFPKYAFGESLALSAGFGYYSLSSLIISRTHGASLGTLALLANIFREILTLLSAPLLARYLGPLAPVASGGATAMDTTAPVIARYSGNQAALYGIYSGVVLTLAVPVLVPLLLAI